MARRTVQQVEQQLQAAAADIQRLRTGRDKYKAKYHMARNTTYASLAFNVVLLALVAVGMFIYAPTTAEGKTPDHVLASVHMANGNSCSGTVVYDPKIKHTQALILSCAHCVAGNVGKSCWWHNPDGTPFRAKLVAVDRSRDLSLFITDRKNTLAGVPVAATWNKDETRWSVCGYPQGRGPKFREASFIGEGGDGAGMARWKFRVKKPYIIGGDSGCGVFVKGELVGVLSHRETEGPGDNSPNPVLLCSQYSQLHGFLQAECPDVTNCPPWGCPPRRRQRRPDNGGAPPPPPFTPEPNVPIEPEPDDQVPNTPVPPRNDRQRSNAIQELRDKIAELEKRTGVPGPPGATGPQGPQGPQGEGAEVDTDKIKRMDALIVSNSNAVFLLKKQVALLDKLIKTVEQRGKDTALDAHRNTGELASFKTELELMRKLVEDVNAKTTANALADKDLALRIQRFGQRLDAVEKKQAGTIKFRVRVGPDGKPISSQ